MSSANPDLLLYNANVITLDASLPRASWVAASRGRIVDVGVGRPPQGLPGVATRRVDCQGSTLVPGFIDAHCHILATASALLSLDCSPAAVSSIEDIGERVRERALQVPQGTWLRGTGYNEFYLREARHPNRRELDRAAPGHPVRLLHRSGHAAVLNSRALEMLGIHRETPDPPDGIIEREESTGEPTGLLLEMSDYLEGMVPPLTRQELSMGVGMLNERCLSWGITSLQDATPTNSIERWGLIASFRERGLLTPTVTLMAGAVHLPLFLQEGLAFGHERSGLRVGAAKIMLTMTTGVIQPPREELRRSVREAHGSGFPVAIHAVEMEAVEEAIEAIRLATSEGPLGALRHRIEHCSECPPELLQRLARERITVVTQPGFLFHSGERYLAQVPGDRLPWLYRIGSLRAAGVPVAFGSDAPVISMDPRVGLYAATTRRAESGETVLAGEAVTMEAALRAYTLGSAYAAFEEERRGSIVVGKRADLALLDRDPLAIAPEEVLGLRMLMTVAGGEVVWEG